MSEQKSDPKELMFIGLLQSFVSSAWIQLGMRENPMTGKTAVNLDEAQFTIDMLEMIGEKTKGNLSEQEDRIMQSALSELKTAFVDIKLKHPSGDTQP